MYRRLWTVVGLLSLSSFGCADRGNSPISQEGRVSLAITNAPQDATCIQVLVSGTKNVERDVDVTAGQSTVLSLEGLPEGNDTITVNAYAGSCAMLTASSVATWVGDPVVVMVTPMPVEIEVTLHHNNQNGRVSIGVNFDDDAGRGDASADGGGSGGSAGSGGSGGSAGAGGDTGGSAGSGGTSDTDAGTGTGGGTVDSGPTDICSPLHSDTATCGACEDLNCPHD